MNRIGCTLLVDDDPINNFINQQLIDELEITDTLTLVNNGQEAVDFLKDAYGDAAKCPDLILLDINMPVMDGFEFLQEFKHMAFPHKDKVKIVMLTTSTSQKDAERLEEHKIAGFIHKPLTVEKLMELVDKLFP